MTDRSYTYFSSLKLAFNIKSTEAEITYNISNLFLFYGLGFHHIIIVTNLLNNVNNKLLIRDQFKTKNDKINVFRTRKIAIDVGIML